MNHNGLWAHDAAAQNNKDLYFSSFEEAMGFIPTMDQAEAAKVYTGGLFDAPEDENSLYTLSENHKAVLNTTTGKVAQVCSDKYQILQHRDFFALTLSALEHAGLSGTGRFVPTNDGNRWKMQVLFDNIKVSEPGRENNLQVGGEFINSYNATKSASGRAFYMRLSCANQMTIRNIIPNVVFSKNHVSENQEILLTEAQEKILDYVDNLLMNSTAIEQVIEEAMDSMVSFDDPAQIVPTLTSILGAQKHADGIYGTIIREHPMLDLTKWDLYNAVTDYASHADISPGVQETILERAESKILSPKAVINILNPEEKLPPVVA